MPAYVTSRVVPGTVNIFTADGTDPVNKDQTDAGRYRYQGRAQPDDALRRASTGDYSRPSAV